MGVIGLKAFGMEKRGLKVFRMWGWSKKRVRQRNNAGIG